MCLGSEMSGLGFSGNLEVGVSAPECVTNGVDTNGGRVEVVGRVGGAGVVGACFLTVIQTLEDASPKTANLHLCSSNELSPGWASSAWHLRVEKDVGTFAGGHVSPAEIFTKNIGFHVIFAILAVLKWKNCRNKIQ